jgi:tetratricopeptide (TPR) repeat protein
VLRDTVLKILKTARDLAGQGKVELAIVDCQETLTRHPKEAQVYLCLGDLSVKNQLMPEAVEAYDQAAKLFLGEGSLVNAVSCYKQIVKIEPRRADVCVLLGDLNAGRGHVNNAVADYLVGAKFYTQNAGPEDALNVYRKILALMPHNTGVRLRVAELHLKQGQTAEAIEEYLRVAQHYKLSERESDAQALYELVLKHSAGHPEASHALNVSTEEVPAVQWDGAVEQERVDESDPVELEAPEEIAVGTESSNGSAVEESAVGTESSNGSAPEEVAVDEVPDIDMVILTEAKVFEPLINDEDSSRGEDIVEVVATDPAPSFSTQLEEDLDARYELALAYKEMGLLDEAIETFEDSVRGPNHYLDSCAMIAMCYNDRRMNRSAIEWLERAINDPRCEGAFALSAKFALAQLYETEGDSEKAAHLYGCIPGIRLAAERLASTTSFFGNPDSATGETPAL